MAANFPGSNNALPGAYTLTETVSRGVSIPSGTKTAVIIGEGARTFTIVASAIGGGNDGLNSLYTSTTGADGRHFLLPDGPLVQNRTKVYKNGIQLTLTEGEISGSFDSRFQVRVDPDNGQLELQAAALVDQGGLYYRASTTNAGDGTISGLSLVDDNAPTETWTIKCVSVLRDGYGDPIDGYARFIASGSVSGILLDGYGQQITWRDNSTSVSNGVLQFSIAYGASSFLEGDTFVVQVTGGALLANDKLTAEYIAVADTNDPEFFTDMVSLASKHGYPSTTNTLSLGAQLAFANGAPGVWALEAAPPLPRRLSYSLVDSATGDADADDLSFALPLNVTPDADANINFFVTDIATGVETQIVPNKVAFYDASLTSNPSLFHFGGSYAYSYTVILDDSVQKSGSDGELTILTGTTATLSSAAVTFTAGDVGATKSLRIFNATNAANNGTFTILSVADGDITITAPGGFVAETSLQFELLDSATTSARVLFTDDLALGAGDSLRATVVDTLDADFFDAGWVSAYAAAEKIDVWMVVPLPSQTKSAVFLNGKAHVEKMSGIKNRRERVLLTGALAGLEPDHVIGNELAAVEDIGVLEGIQGDSVTEVLAGTTEDLTNYKVQDAFGSSFRCMYFYPDECVVQVGADRFALDGFYMAPAAAGFFSGNSNDNTPLTNKTLSGFSLTRDKLYAPTVLENIAAAGITVLQPVAGGGLVQWGKTTTTSGFAEEEEISIIFIRDRISRDLRTAFQGFTGVAETPTFQQTLFARATSVAQSFISRRLITEYRDLNVVRDSVEPRQWNISLAVQPVYPVGWIFLKTSVGLL